MDWCSTLVFCNLQFGCFASRLPSKLSDMDKRSAKCVKPLVRGVWIHLGDYQRRLPLSESAAYQIERFLKTDQNYKRNNVAQFFENFKRNGFYKHIE
jgi:hypothetical protein